MLNKHNLNIASLCCKEQSRYTLNSILVTPTDTRVTDGHIAMAVTRPAMSADDYPVIDNVTPDKTATFLLDAKTAGEVSKCLPNGKAKFPILRNAIIGQETASGKRPIAVTDLETERIFQAKPGSGQFPNFDFVFEVPRTPTPTNGKEFMDPLVQVYLDADILTALLAQVKAMAVESKAGASPFLLTIYSPEHPVRIDAITAEDQQISAAIMPMSAPEKAIVPRVFGKPEPVTVEPPAAE